MMGVPISAIKVYGPPSMFILVLFEKADDKLIEFVSSEH
jgi:hypothetical protein